MKTTQIANTIFRLSIIGLLTGTICAISTILFLKIVQQFNYWFSISSTYQFYENNSFWIIIASVSIPTIGGLIIGWFNQTMEEKKPRGLGDCIKSAHLLKKFHTKDNIKSTCSSVLSLGCGASVGQFGPVAHLGAQIGSFISAVIGEKSLHMSTIGIGCGSAAAISVAFQAPLAGIVFAHEVILRHHSLRAFAPITMASAVGYFISSELYQPQMLTKISNTITLSFDSFLFCIAIGLLGALVSTALIKTLLSISRYKENSIKNPIILTGMAGLAVGICGIFVPEAIGSGQATISSIINENAFNSFDLSLILILKLIMTALCLALGFAGGIFGPSLLIGAAFGSLFGIGVEFFFTTTIQSTDLIIYTVCGIVAVLSPVLGAPLTSILVILELTQNYSLAIAAMTSVVFSNLLAYRICGRSIYDIQLKSKGFDLAIGRDNLILNQETVGEYYSTDCSIHQKDHSLQSALNLLTQTQHAVLYIVDDQQRYIGCINIQRLMALYQTADLSKTIPIEDYEQSAIVFKNNTTLFEAMADIRHFIGESIPVIDENNKFLGVVFETTIIEKHLQITEITRKEEHASG